MYANDIFFTSGVAERRAKQEPFIASPKSISGRITEIKVVDKQGICAFRNFSTFTDSEGTDHQIDRMSCQIWEGGTVVDERYYDSAKMYQTNAAGILNNPIILSKLAWSTKTLDTALHILTSIDASYLQNQ